MKKMLVTLVAACAFISANAQLENTKWKATLQFDSPTKFTQTSQKTPFMFIRPQTIL